eukprot:2342017-Ditylum_brightwellii.AAC.1
MKTVPISTQNNPNVKRAVIAFQRPQARQLKQGQCHISKLRTTPVDPTSPIYKLSATSSAQGIKRYAGTPKLHSCKDTSQGQCVNGFQAGGNQPQYAKCAHFELCLDDVAEHVFPEKAGQTQKCYMCRNLRLVGEMTVKEWVAWVSELNEYLKDFPTQNGNKYSH